MPFHGGTSHLAGRVSLLVDYTYRLVIRMAMDIVAFITTELGGDLIVSFAVQKPDDPTRIESLTLIRTPKYESFLEPEECGVSVSFERFLDDAGRDLLQDFSFSKREAIVELKTALRHYRLDVRKVDPKELADMHSVLRRMNFDNCFRLN